MSPGETFSFDVHLFDIEPPILSYFVLVLRELGSAGIGPGRGRATLVRAEVLPLEEGPVETIFESNLFTNSKLSAPRRLSLDPLIEVPPCVTVEFVTPTEIKYGETLLERPEFPPLFSRIRDRIATLADCYAGSPLPIDFRALGEASKQVRMVACSVEAVHGERTSSRTGETHPLGGFVGEAIYEGDFRAFLPFLKAAQWTGVGRQTVWGKGALRIY